MYPYLYVLEKLSNAVRILAIGEGDVRSRLLPAFVEFHTLMTTDLPPNLQSDYEWIITELTKRQPKDQYEMREWNIDGSVQANLRRMKNRTGSQIALKIFDLTYHIQVLYEQWQEAL